jgi:hypothetical protein
MAMDESAFHNGSRRSPVYETGVAVRPRGDRRAFPPRLNCANPTVAEAISITVASSKCSEALIRRRSPKYAAVEYNWWHLGVNGDVVDPPAPRTSRRYARSACAASSCDSPRRLMPSRGTSFSFGHVVDVFCTQSASRRDASVKFVASANASSPLTLRGRTCSSIPMRSIRSGCAVSAAAGGFDDQCVAGPHFGRVAPGQLDGAAIGAFHAVVSQRPG